MRSFRITLLCIFFTTYSFAQDQLPSLLSRLAVAKEDTGKVLLLKSVVYYYNNIKPDSAIFYAKKGLALSEQLNYTKGMADMHRILGEQDLNHGKMDDAKVHFETALALYEQLKNYWGIAGVDNGLGICAAKQGNYTAATQSFLKALAINEQTNDTDGIVQAYIKLGAVEMQNGNLDKGLAYFNKGNALVKNAPQSNTTGTLLNDIGNVYSYKHDYATALTYYLQGLRKITDPHLADVRILLLINTGGSYNNLHNRTLAYKYDYEALSLIRQRGLKESEINILVNIAELLSSTKPDSSAILLDQAYKIAKDIHQNYLMLDVYQGMVDLNKQRGNYKQAELILERKNLLQDSLFTLKKEEDISELQSNYKLAQQKVNLQHLELTNQQFKFRQALLIGIAAAIFLLLVIVFIFYRRTGRMNKVLLERKKELRRQKNELHRLNNFKDKLFSIIAHDLRSPVATVVGMLELAEDGAVSADEVQVFIPQLKEQSKATLDILDKLLIWGRSQLKGVSNNRSSINVKELITKSISLYSNAIQQKEIVLADDYPETIQVYADITHVEFVIRNILANAIKYTNIGGKIEIYSLPDNLPGYNTIVIKDNGVGIAKELQQQIFEPGNKSMDGTQKEKGNSIGLMLCKEFVEDNNGKIELQSELGKGTRFLISFPLA